ARYRQRHAAQRGQVRNQTADRNGRAVVRVIADVVDELAQQLIGAEDAIRAAALEGELAGHHLPALSHFAYDHIIWNENVFEYGLVEVVTAVKVVDRASAYFADVDDELREPGVAVLSARRGARQRNQVMRAVGAAGPDLGAVEQPATVGLGGLHAGGGQVGAGVGLAHADGEVAAPGGDLGKNLRFGRPGAWRGVVGPVGLAVSQLVPRRGAAAKRVLVEALAVRTVG